MAIQIKLKNASGSDPSASDLVVGEVAIGFYLLIA